MGIRDLLGAADHWSVRVPPGSELTRDTLTSSPRPRLTHAGPQGLDVVKRTTGQLEEECRLKISMGPSINYVRSFIYYLDSPPSVMLHVKYAMEMY